MLPHGHAAHLQNTIAGELLTTRDAAFAHATVHSLSVTKLNTQSDTLEIGPDVAANQADAKRIKSSIAEHSRVDTDTLASRSGDVVLAIPSIPS